ncbi:hypothetical protein [Rhizobium sp. CSW-27]|uniref:hypothetical protein n=1 Tax=Rhizobium sp. CSW-27 TaxID=2839985 RepID=UPI001C0347D9|nr:hypothetical protein [Rhizobium sp. CSW-27]MBT9371844.1 hypothetical protein [Rhizobium sp. CSW-27]
MSSIAGQSELERDAMLAGRFDQRVRSFVRFAVPLHVAGIVLNLALDQQAVAALAHLLMAAMAWIIGSRSKDGIRTIIFTNVYWMFSFATYAYAALYGQTASHGLGNAERSALVALCSQFGLYFAYLMTPNKNVMQKSNQNLSVRRRFILVQLQYVFLFAGFVGVVVDRFGLVPAVYSSTISGLLFITISVRLSSAKAVRDPVLWLILGTMIFVSAAGNGRTALMSLLLMLGFAMMMLKEKIITPGTLIVAYLTARTLSIFSAIILSIRWARDTSLSLPLLFAEKFFSLETVISILNPFYINSSKVELMSAPADTGGFYSAFYSASSDSLLNRLTLLPQMDIVVSKLWAIEQVRWDDLWGNLFWNVLPNIFGQEKDLYFSDQVVWELGLRDWSTIGRPMITIQGELFAIGGYACVFIVTFALYYIMSYMYGVMTRLMGSRVSGILVTSQLFVNGFLSTTLLSVTLISTRGPLQFVIMISLIYFLYNSFVKSEGPLRKRKFA